MSRAYFVTGPQDHEDLMRFASSIGLHLVAMVPGQSPAFTPERGPIRYLSVKPESQLKPYPYPAKQPYYSTTTEPLMLFKRSYPDPPYFLTGDVEWDEDSRAMAEITKPYYRRIVKWIRDHWEKRVPGKPYYYGPEAMKILDENPDMQIVTFKPGTVKIEEVEVKPPE